MPKVLFLRHPEDMYGYREFVGIVEGKGHQVSTETFQDYSGLVSQDAVVFWDYATKGEEGNPDGLEIGRKVIQDISKSGTQIGLVVLSAPNQLPTDMKRTRDFMVEMRQNLPKGRWDYQERRQGVYLLDKLLAQVISGTSTQ
ncbi:hypothetical protein HYU14_06165 [Candidatus Woesearchaeota archaeon]|nr:hypothetical protein [Candidatus Woesearchaeota archaeon]